MVLPVPLGSETAPRTCWSACLASTPSRACSSTVASNRTVDVSLTTWQAGSGASPSAPLLCSASSTLRRASWYFFPCLLANDFQPHGASRPLDHLDRLLDVVRGQVLGLGLGDGDQLLARDLADLLLPGAGRPLLDPDRLLQQVDGGRRLQHEAEAAVLEDGDLGRHHVARLGGGPLVVRPGELHDVHSVGAEHGADRRRRGRLPGLQLDLQHRADLLLRHSLSAPSPLAAGPARPGSPDRTC